MRLSEYLEMPGQSASALARECNVAVSTITRVAKRTKAPSIKLMIAIRAATKNAVTANDFLPPYEDACTEHQAA